MSNEPRKYKVMPGPVAAARLKKSLLSWNEEPIIFRKRIQQWPAADWTPVTLADLLGEQKVKFRVGSRETTDVQWETECSYVDATIQDFLNWEQQPRDEKINNKQQEPELDKQPPKQQDPKQQEQHDDAVKCNPLQPFHPDTHWVYMDYKYMARVFKDQPDQLKAVDWSVFGFEGRGGADSTLWLGSPGAYTVCHSDTYGCNLVAQLHGRKRWALFPPQQGSCMYPTRLPYEESSVFSQVNVQCPDLDRHPKFQDVDPYVVTLEPGDVLFVPRHWWHFVQNLETSISINSWIDMEDVDEFERLQEAITRAVVCSMMSCSGDVHEDSWLNPTETLTAPDLNLAYVTYLSQSLNILGEKRAPPKLGLSPGTSKKPTEEQEETDKPLTKAEITEMDSNIRVLKPCSFQEFLAELLSTKPAAAEAHCSKGGRVIGDSASACKLSEANPTEGRVSEENTAGGSDGDKVKPEEKTIDNGTPKSTRETAQLKKVSMADLVDCIVQPEVVKLISEKLLEKINIPQ